MPVTRVCMYVEHTQKNSIGWKLLKNIKQKISIKYFRLQFDSPLPFEIPSIIFGSEF